MAVRAAWGGAGGAWVLCRMCHWHSGRGVELVYAVTVANKL